MAISLADPRARGVLADGALCPGPESRDLRAPDRTFPVLCSGQKCDHFGRTSSDHFARSLTAETMSILAPQVGVQPSELLVPIARLKSSGQVKTAGRRQFTRYFPVGDSDCAE